MSKCKRCSTELVKDKDRDCLYCPLCHPIQKQSVPMEELEKNYIDVKPSDMRKEEIIKIIKGVVPSMIIEELENWHIKKPVEEPVVEEPVVEELDENKNWRDEAKELEIETYDKENSRPRKKVDILIDIEKKKIS